MNHENLGPAERIINALLTYQDHMIHNRPGVVVRDGHTTIGVRWSPATYKVEGDVKVVYRLDKAGNKTTRVKIGNLVGNKVMEGGREVAEYRQAGFYPEVAAWMYRQVAEVWKLDNEFAAHWASYAFGEDHKDLKVVLAAFMLVQARKGDPEIVDGKVAFHDEDYRDIGEAMMLIHDRNRKGLAPKLLLRIHDLLSLPEIAQINRDLGFGKSARRPFLGRWEKAAVKWLQYREENAKLFEGLIKDGYRTTVMSLARIVGYKPETPKFFETLRWKQMQAKDGRRSLAIGQEVAAAETWDGLTEKDICEKIVRERPGFKRIAGLVPRSVGITRAIYAAAIEAKVLSDKDMIIATPTLEDLGLLQVASIREQWERAVKNAEDLRAANIATRVKSKATQEKLAEASDNALKKATEEVTKNLRIYFFVDRSGSQEKAIEAAKRYVTKFLPAFSLDRLHVAHFNTVGKEVEFKHASAAGVENAFKGVTGTGGTDYGSGVRALSHHKPLPDEDVLFIFIGDQQAPAFDAAVRASGLNPLAFGFVYIPGSDGNRYNAVDDTARTLGVPCFRISEDTFSDVYAIPRTIRALVAATPVNAARVQAAPRVTLVEKILKTELLKKPTWAA